jgi:Skp family chaperone for outer membrane proteins
VNFRSALLIYLFGLSLSPTIQGEVKSSMKLKNHSRKTSLFSKVVLGFCLMGGSWIAGSSTPARAADAITVGVLDETRLGKGYNKYSAELDTLNKNASAYDAQLDAREVMNEADGKRFDELISKTTRTPAEEDEFQKLVTAGTARRKERDKLIGQAARTPDEEKRLQESQAFMKANIPAVRRLEDDLFQTLKTTEEATHQKYIGFANEMVKNVAVEKKLTIVFRKDAVVWFAPAIDITDEVLNRLNKK